MFRVERNASMIVAFVIGIEFQRISMEIAMAYCKFGMIRVIHALYFAIVVRRCICEARSHMSWVVCIAYANTRHHREVRLCPIYG